MDRISWWRRSYSALVVLGLVLLAGCVSKAPPLHHPGPYNTPVEAFDATDAPYDPSTPAGADRPLSRDLSQLREARNAYEHSQAVQAARVQDRQARCRQRPGAHLVRIQDGSGDESAVYCQTGPADDADR